MDSALTHTSLPSGRNICFAFSPLGTKHSMSCSVSWGVSSINQVKRAPKIGKQYGGNGFIDSAAEVGPFSRQKVVSMECF